MPVTYVECRYQGMELEGILNSNLTPFYVNSTQIRIHKFEKYSLCNKEGNAVGRKLFAPKQQACLAKEKITIFTKSYSTNIMAPATTSLALDKKGMMDGIDEEDDDDVEDNIDEERKGKMGGPVPDVSYSNPYSGRGGKKVKIKQEKPWGATSTATSNPSNNHYPPATINIAETTAGSQLSSSIPGLNSIIDMSMTEIEADSHISLVKTCVKKKMFSYWKFYDKNNDNQYSMDEGTMCGFIIKHTGIEPKKCNKDWWVEMRKTVLKTHTDLRNNAIKTLQIKFKGKNKQAVLNCKSKLTYTGNINPINTSRRGGFQQWSSTASPLWRM